MKSVDIILLATAGALYAAPFMVTQPVPTNDPSVAGQGNLWSYTFSGIASPWTTPATVDADGSVHLVQI
jgi:hypothetical protein